MTPGVRAVLGMVALLPLLSLAWFSASSYRSASNSVRQSAELEELSETANALVALGSNLAYEGYYASSIVALEQFGVPVAMVGPFLGVDLVGENRQVAAVVDQLIDEQGLDEIGRRLAEVRAVDDAGPLGVSTLYDEVAADVGVLADAIIDDVNVLASVLTNAGEVDFAKKRLALTVDLRETAAVLITGSFGVRFVPADQVFRVEDALAILASSGVYLDQAEELDSTVAPGSQLAAAWASLRASASLADLTDQVFQLSRDIAQSGIAAVGSIEFASASLEDFVAEDIQSEARAFTESIAVLEGHGDLVAAAAADLATAARDIGEAAADRQQMVMIAILVVGAMALTVIVVGGRWIVGPLRSMSRHVESIRDGDLSVRVVTNGPREVALAAEALNEATEHLRLAEAQVSALARQELDDPVLDEGAPGRLGESLQSAVSQLATSLHERDQFRRRLAHESTHDGLTGLLNRPAVLTSIGQGIARTQRAGSEMAVMLVNLDAFREINERHGSSVGDRVLRETARSIVNGVRAGDVVGRLAGDEFVIVAEAIGSPGEAVALAERVRAEVTQPLDIEGLTLAIETSVGVALVSSGSLSADEMMRDADLAVFQAKTSGGSRVEVCDVALRHELAARASTETELRSAIENGGIEVFYQTIHRATDLGNHSVEALVRWRLPDGSMRFPDTFIPIAERSDLIVALDNAVLDGACCQLARWQQDHRFRDLSVSFNVSARHLAAGSLVEDFEERITRHGVPAHRLAAEVTESTLLEDLDGAAMQLNQLRQLGAKVAIDDFGTGYTSLSHLRQLPFDVVKIDRSFVSNLAVPEDRKLVNMIVDVGHTLGAEIVAEGVETPSDVHALRELGVDYLQGFNFSRPAPSAEVEETLLLRSQVSLG